MKQSEHQNKTAALFFVLSLACGILLLTGCSKPGDTMIQQAMEESSKHHYDKAIELYKQAESAESRYSPALIDTLIAGVYGKMEDYQNAAVYQKKALDEHGDYSGWITLGMMYRSIEKNDEAEAAYKSAIDLDGTKAEAYESLGALYLSENRAADSVPMLEKAAALNDRLAIARADLAVAYAELGRKADAEAAYAKAAELKCANIDQFRARIDEIYAAAALPAD